MEEIRMDPQMTAAEEQTAVPEKPAKKKGKIALIVLGAVAAALVAGCAGICIAASLSDTILKGTSVLEVDMGGLSREEAEALWQSESRHRLANTRIPLLLEGEKAGAASLEGLGVSVSPEAAAKAAWDAGHTGNFFTDGWLLARSWFEKTPVLPEWTVDRAKLRRKAEVLGVALADTVVDGEWWLDEEKTDGFYVVKPADGKRVDAEKLRLGLEESLNTTGLAPVTCYYTTVKAKQVDLAAIHQELVGEMANSIYDKKNGGVTLSRIGVSFDLDRALDVMEKATPGETFVVPGTVAFPKVTETELEEVLFRDELGSVTTYVSGSWQRIANVRVAAAQCDSYILNPGESFSYNDTLGPTTAENGYYPAPSYIGGKTVDSYGGGVCQVCSTMYYATLLANLEIVTRYNHQYAPDYIPLGCDATVFEGPIDYIFRNNTDYPIKIETYWNGYYLTVSLWGTKVDDTYVEVVSSVLESYPWETVYQETDELPPGQTKEEQTPYTGYYVKTWRNVYAGDGTLLSSTLESVSDYDSRDRIILVGKTPPPDPTPDPDPGVTPDPTPDPDPGVTPDPTPDPDPGVTPDPTPDPDPGVTPDPTPDPDPGETPDPDLETSTEN